MKCFIKDKPERSITLHKNLVFEDDPELTLLFATMTKHQTIKFLKEAIRDTNDEDCKKMYRYLLEEVKKNP